MVDFDKTEAETLKRNLNKVQCWITGYHAGAGHKPNMLGAGIPGEDAVRQAQIFLGDLIRAFEAQAKEPAKPEPVADDEGWITHDGSGMPVSGDTLVTIKCRDGYTDSYEARYFLSSDFEGYNDWWKWKTCYKKDDEIVAYKISNA